MLPKDEYRISITSRCNMKCEYCHNEGNKKINELNIENIRTIMDNSYGFNMKNVRLTGGEPLIHPQIIEICKMLSSEYNLKVGINTNCIEINKLLYMIKNGWIDRVVVGLDYFDESISKKSPVGKSSKEILDNILKIKTLGCDVSISTVYDNNYENIHKLVKWCIKNEIRIKIIEIIKNEIYDTSDINYLNMRDKIINDFNFEIKIDKLEEYNCYVNGKRIITFFPSLCRLRRCDLCKKIHLRITSEGKIKQCIQYNEDDADVIGEESRKNIIKELKREVNYHMEV